MPPKAKAKSASSSKKATWRKAILKAKQGRKTFSMIVGPTYIKALKGFCK
jgi:hypothetical protein